MNLYRITNRMNGMSYIGATGRTIAQRMGDHRSQAKKHLTHPLSVAIREYGWDAFDVTVLGSYNSLSELHVAERATIAAIGTLVPAGYNRASGGLGTPDCFHSKETIGKISKRAIGRKAWNVGIKTGPLSAEWKARISVGQLGREAWNKGIPATDEHRAALRASHAGKLNHAARSVEFEGRIFQSIKLAASELGLSRMQVRYKLQTGKARYLDKEV